MFQDSKEQEWVAMATPLQQPLPRVQYSSHLEWAPKFATANSGSSHHQEIIVWKVMQGVPVQQSFPEPVDVQVGVVLNPAGHLHFSCSAISRRGIRRGGLSGSVRRLRKELQKLGLSALKATKKKPSCGSCSLLPQRACLNSLPLPPSPPWMDQWWRERGHSWNEEPWSHNREKYFSHLPLGLNRYEMGEEWPPLLFHSEKNRVG